jgi:hypothetical protein
VASNEHLTSVKLLARVFSLLSLPEELKSVKLQLKKETLDFELALFTTYAQQLRQNMKFVF